MSEALRPFLESRPEGLRAPAFDAFVDPPGPAPRAILTHAHADHAAAGHGEVWATADTIALYRRRHPDWEGAARAFDYGESAEENGVRLRFHSAGHVLGSAQLWFGDGRESLLYTGDFKRRSGRTAAPAEAPGATTLLTETTFGLPVFRFPPPSEIEARLVAACREAFADGRIPILLAYALGKAQEAAAILGSAGIPCVLHGAAWKLLADYAAAGIALPLCRPYESGTPAAGEALIVPPSCVRTPVVRRISRRSIVYLSGWAIREAARAEFDADVLLPMSDHADFDELIQHAREVGAGRVVTLHGYARDFARILAGRGVAAEALAEESAERGSEDATP